MVKIAVVDAKDSVVAPRGISRRQEKVKNSSGCSITLYLDIGARSEIDREKNEVTS